MWILGFYAALPLKTRENETFAKFYWFYIKKKSVSKTKVDKIFLYAGQANPSIWFNVLSIE